jgi:hypothetical protein
MPNGVIPVAAVRRNTGIQIKNMQVNIRLDSGVAILARRNDEFF